MEALKTLPQLIGFTSPSKTIALAGVESLDHYRPATPFGTRKLSTCRKASSRARSRSSPVAAPRPEGTDYGSPGIYSRVGGLNAPAGCAGRRRTSRTRRHGAPATARAPLLPSTPGGPRSTSSGRRLSRRRNLRRLSLNRCLAQAVCADQKLSRPEALVRSFYAPGPEPTTEGRTKMLCTY